MLLFSGDDGVWDSTADTPLKRDTSKFSCLSVEDLKAINPLDSDTPSPEVEGNTTLSMFKV